MTIIKVQKEITETLVSIGIPEMAARFAAIMLTKKKEPHDVSDKRFLIGLPKEAREKIQSVLVAEKLLDPAVIQEGEEFEKIRIKKHISSAVSISDSDLKQELKKLDSEDKSNKSIK